MIKKVNMEIISTRFVAKETVEIILKNKYISEKAQPGQFLHISVPGHTLRRPISIAVADEKSATITILFKIVGAGTRQLASMKAGMTIDALGPNGNGFPLPDPQTSPPILLIGGGIGIPPIYFLAKKMKDAGIPFQVILGFQEKAYVFYEKAFTKLTDTYIVTNDGSYGYTGFVTDVFGAVKDFGQYYACGPLPMLAAVYHGLPEKEGFLSFEERMGCGVGACYACVIPTNDASGSKKICHDGPVFAASEVKL